MPIWLNIRYIILIPYIVTACLLRHSDYSWEPFYGDLLDYFNRSIFSSQLREDIRYLHYEISILGSSEDPTCSPPHLLSLLIKHEEMLYIAGYEEVASDFFASPSVQVELGKCLPCISYRNSELWNEVLEAALSGMDVLRQAPYSNTTSVDFVVSFCGASHHQPSSAHSHLRTTDSLEWLADILSKSLPVTEVDRPKTRLRVFVMEKCHKKATDSELYRSHQNLLSSLTPYIDHIQTINVDEDIRADDCTAYIAHIVHRYSDLSDFTFFIHPDIQEHAIMSFVERTIRVLLSGRVSPKHLPFMYLSHNNIDLSPDSNSLWEPHASSHLWKSIFGSSIAPARSAIKGYCCSQFVVSKERIKLRPREFYENALRTFESYRSYTGLSPFDVVTPRYDVICRTPCQLNMPWWHIYFGENLLYPQLSENTKLPLAIQMAIPPGL